MYLRQCQLHSDYPVPYMWLPYCVFVFYGQIKIDRYCCFLCRLFWCCSKFVQDKFNLSITVSGYVAGAVYYVSMILSPFLGFIIVSLQLHLAVLAFVDVVHNGDAKISLKCVRRRKFSENVLTVVVGENCVTLCSEKNFRKVSGEYFATSQHLLNRSTLVWLIPSLSIPFPFPFRSLSLPSLFIPSSSLSAVRSRAFKYS